MEYFLTKEQYKATVAHWKLTKHHESWEHIIYNILRSKSTKVGFTERTQNIQGNDPLYEYHRALNIADNNIFGKYNKVPFDFKKQFGIDLPNELQALIHE